MLQAIRGTKDILPDEMATYRYIIQKALGVASLYNFHEVQTPIFESTDVFKRTLGDESDVVSKEMYTFEDRGGDSITLRPEGTAPIVRAIISNGLTQSLPLKYMYAGPMFRYERPQKGRLRQFHQIGCELIGPSTPLADVETIVLGQAILSCLGLNQNVKLQLNSLGDKESRDNYRIALVDYLSKYKDSLSEDSKRRLEKNPLRILDSKDNKDREIVENAPALQDYYTDASQQHFGEVQQKLETLDIPFKVNSQIVRGLDYYSHTVFEFITTDLGAQGTVLAGGRYNNLVQQLGGPQISCVGWAAGIERLALLLEGKIRITPSAPTCVVIPADTESEDVCFSLLQNLRENNISADMGYSGNMSKRLKKADQTGAKYALILGRDELSKNSAMLKNLESGDSTLVPIDRIINNLQST